MRDSHSEDHQLRTPFLHTENGPISQMSYTVHFVPFQLRPMQMLVLTPAMGNLRFVVFSYRMTYSPPRLACSFALSIVGETLNCHYRSHREWASSFWLHLVHQFNYISPDLLSTEMSAFP